MVVANGGRTENGSVVVVEKEVVVKLARPNGRFPIKVFILKVVVVTGSQFLNQQEA